MSPPNWCLCERDHILLSAPPLDFPMASEMRSAVIHRIDKRLVERANTVLLLGILWSALGICVLAALAYDVAQWFDGL